MTVVDNKTVIFKKIPTGMPVPGEHLVVENRPFDLDAAPPAGGVIVEILSLSLDPYLRFRMREPHIESYTPAYQLNEAADNDTISRVLRADGASPYAAGDLLYAYLPFAEYAALSAEQAAKATRLDNPFGLAPEMFLGPLGMPGLTAYSSLHQIGHLKKGETIFISSAAGAVGQVAGQIAKREGLTVIGSVGSDEKLDFVINESGFDGAFNYKKERPWDALKRLAPNGLDIYFENVGGEHLEAAIENLNVHGRIIVCGFISSYNKPLEERYGVRNIQEFFAKRLSMAGFLVFDEEFGPAWTEEHQQKVQQWIADGSFPAKLHITHGIDNGPKSLVEIFEGKNFGKAVLKVKE